MKPSTAQLLRQIVDPGLRPLTATAVASEPASLPPLPELIGWVMGPPAPLPRRSEAGAEASTPGARLPHT